VNDQGKEQVARLALNVDDLANSGVRELQDRE
jgi:hypothetical protein